MLNLHENHFPKPCHDEPPRPHYTPLENMESVTQEMRDTIKRMFEMEEILTEKVETMLSHVSKDNVIFKESFNEAYRQFLETVRSEINTFEGNTDSAIRLFTTTIEKQYNDLSTDCRQQISEYYNDIILYIRTNINGALMDIVRQMREDGTLIWDAYVTPQMFGAKGDGVTDDIEAFRAALNSKRLLYIPNGTYYVSENIEVNNVGQRIIGESQNAKIIGGITVDGTTSPAYRTYMEIKNLTIDSAEGAREGVGIRLVSCANVLIDGVVIKNKSRGIMSEGALIYTVKNSTFDSCAVGVDFEKGTHPANNVKFESCKITSNALAIYADGGDTAKGVVFDACEIEHNNHENLHSYAISINSTPTLGGVPIMTFTGCWFEDNFGTASIRFISNKYDRQVIFTNNVVVNTANACDNFIECHTGEVVFIAQNDPSTYNGKTVKVTGGRFVSFASLASHEIDDDNNAIVIGYNGMVNSNLFFNGTKIRMKSQGGSDDNAIYSESNKLKIKANTNVVELDGAKGVDMTNSYAKPMKIGTTYVWEYNGDFYGKKGSMPESYIDGTKIFSVND